MQYPEMNTEQLLMKQAAGVAEHVVVYSLHVYMSNFLSLKGNEVM